MTEIKTNLNHIKETIAQSCLSVDRNPADVELMLVTKTVPVERIAQTCELGHRLFGENRIQEVAKKWREPVLHGIKPEFIGHLQTNKIKNCLDLCGRIHSMDRLGLVEALDGELQRRGECREIFLQVNTSEEDSKYGVPWQDAVQFAKVVSRYQTLKVTGLMTLAVFSKEEVRVRQCFKKLRELLTMIRNEGVFSENFRQLSMGMSSDYHIAIQEGATLVRIGTAVYGERNTSDSYYWPEHHK